MQALRAGLGRLRRPTVLRRSPFSAEKAYFRDPETKPETMRASCASSASDWSNLFTVFVQTGNGVCKCRGCWSRCRVCCFRHRTEHTIYA